MADEQNTTITAPATTVASVVDSAPAASPAIDATASVPSVVTDAAPQTEATVVTEKVAPVSEPAKAETPTPPVTESVLGDEKPDAKKDDVKPDAKTETATETKVELPTYEPFKLPENVSLGKEPLDAFSKILGEIETGKLDHAAMQEKGQALIDLAAKSTLESINRLNDYYVQIHENQKKEWFESAKKDPELGNGDDKVFTEIASNLRSSIDTYAGNAEQQKEFRALMKDTGVGNHPALLRMLNNMQKKIDSYTKETSGRSVPAQAPAPSKVKDYQRFYSGVQG